MIYAMNDLKKRVLLFFFLISFFVFLLGGHFCYEYFGMELKHYFGDEYYIHSNICLLLSLCFILIGSIFHEKFRIKLKTVPFKLKQQYDYCLEKNKNTTNSYIIKVRNISTLLFYITFLFWQAILLERVFFVKLHSYTSFYVDFKTTIPFLFRALGALSPCYFYIFLATFPSKKESKIPILLYCWISILSLFTGRRSNLVIGFMFIALYYTVRHYKNIKEGWIKKYTIITVLIVCPVLIILLYIWGYSRVGESFGKINFLDGILGFFQQQGFSSSVLRLEKFYEYALPKNRFYSFYSIVKNFRLNTIIKLLFNPQYGFSYLSNNVELALKGNSLDHALSYLKLYNYTEGAGVGSCYIAELYHDFGFLGIALGNLLYANIMCLIPKIWMGVRKYNIWLVAVGFAMVESFLKSPRWNFDIVFAYFLDFGMWMAIFSVYLCAHFSWNKNISKYVI